MSRRIYLYDSTLRDGAQTSTVNFNVQNKIDLSFALDKLGIDYIEGGWPGANPTDDNFFAKLPSLQNSQFVAFGMTKKNGISAENDPGLNALTNSSASAVCIVGKSWDFHLKNALQITSQENEQIILQSLQHIVAKKKLAMFDAEHFFDGYKNNKKYALECIRSAYDNGARWVILCDTNGGTLPFEIEEIVNDVAKVIPGKNLGIHTHNDTENAVANTLAAIRSGARQVQGTLNGLGERCGNANIVSIIPTLLLKKYFKDKFDISVEEKKIKYLTECSRLLDEILNRKPNNHAAYVGASAFAHKGGLHVSAVEKNPKTYEHIVPESVGNKRNIVISDQSGRSNILSRLEKLNIKINKDDPKVQKLLEQVKDREFIGYAYDGADASFELLTRRLLGEVPNYLNIKKYEVKVSKSNDNDLINSYATVILQVDKKDIICEGSGNGPVNAIDNAIRSNVNKIGKYSEYLKDLRLVDYKVRILNTGTNAITRVSIESTDNTGDIWFTIGVSPNIIEASFRALIDSIDYKLYKDKAPANL